MRKYVTFIIIICIISACLSGCQKSGTNTSTTGNKTREKIVVAGTGANQELLKVLAAEFMKINAGVEIDVPESIGTGGGITEITAKRIDIARVTRPLKDKEKMEGLVYKEFALTPIVFASSVDITLENIRSEDITRIYSGAITNWKDLGYKDQAIIVTGREPGDSSLSEIEKNLGKLTYDTNLVTVATTDQELISSLKDKQGTIGFGTLSNMKKSGLHVFNLDSKEPLAKDYLIIGKFGFIYWEADMKPGTKAFIDFVCGPDGGKIITQEYCVPVQ